MSAADKPDPAKSAPPRSEGQQTVGHDDVTRPISSRASGAALLKGISEPPRLASLMDDSSANAFDDQTGTDGVPPARVTLLDRPLSFEDKTLTDVVALEEARVLSASEPPPRILLPEETRPALPAEELSTSNLELVDSQSPSQLRPAVPEVELSTSNLEIEDAPVSTVPASVQELSMTDIVASAAIVPDEPPTTPLLPPDDVDTKDILEVASARTLPPIKTSVKPPVPAKSLPPKPSHALASIPPLHKPEELAMPKSERPRPVAKEVKKRSHKSRKGPPYALYAGAAFGILIGVTFALSRPSPPPAAEEVTETAAVTRPAVSAAPIPVPVPSPILVSSASAMPASYEVPVEPKAAAEAPKPVEAPGPVAPAPKPVVAASPAPKPVAAAPVEPKPSVEPEPPPPPPPRVDATRGIVFISGADLVEVDGVPVRVNGNNVVLSCGKHKIKAGGGEARTLDVPCGGSVTL